MRHLLFALLSALLIAPASAAILPEPPQATETCNNPENDPACWLVTRIECINRERLCPSRGCIPPTPEDNFWCYLMDEYVFGLLEAAHPL